MVTRTMENPDMTVTPPRARAHLLAMCPCLTCPLHPAACGAPCRSLVIVKGVVMWMSEVQVKTNPVMKIYPWGVRAFAIAMVMALGTVGSPNTSAEKRLAHASLLATV